ncbi:MAG TPA: hypothetical protein H9671_02965 [Firmicutes bacterium]|nr:hypothetical protein [Bacillota bacterium]
MGYGGAATSQREKTKKGKDEVVMSSGTISLREAAKMLEITVGSLKTELNKSDCPYGFCIKYEGKICYFVSREHLEQWVNDNPQKYHNHPDYISSVWTSSSLKCFSTDELLEELKARCVT